MRRFKLNCYKRFDQFSWLINNCLYVFVEKTSGMSINDSPVQVRLAVPATDDPSMPVLTFRVWVLVLGSNIVCSSISLTQLMIYRQNMPIIIPSTCLVIPALPDVGRLGAILVGLYRLCEACDKIMTNN